MSESYDDHQTVEISRIKESFERGDFTRREFMQGLLASVERIERGRAGGGRTRCESGDSEARRPDSLRLESAWPERHLGPGSILISSRLHTWACLLQQPGAF